jgi:GT2 family glycosyltransferase
MPHHVTGTSRAAAIVLNWNRPADTISCLDSLTQLGERPEVLVVDNGSTNDSVVAIRGHHPWTQVLTLDRNRGFAGGMNAGMLELLDRPNPPEFIWLLNNDTVVEPGALQALIAQADTDPRIGAVGSILLDGSGQRVHEWGGSRLERVLWTTTPLTGATAGRLDCLTGASLFLRVAALLDVGLFDERYFFYLEDTDLSLRLTGGGWLLGVAPDSRVRHVLGATVTDGAISGGRTRNTLYAQSVATFVATWSPRRMRALSLALRLLAMLLRRVSRRQISTLPAVVRAYLRGVHVGRLEPRIPRPGKVVSAGLEIA